MNNQLRLLKENLPNLPSNKLQEGIKRLEKGEPVQYIIGNVNFYGYKIIVNKDVLIPRFETEELIYKTIQYIKKYLHSNISIVDIGTGSGCIAITLKKKLPDCKISAVDVSKKAIDVALENAELNNVNIDFILGNMLEPLTKKYDCIISNPPYISYDEEIMDIVKNNEPHLALYAKENGLQFYKEILSKAQKHLNKNSIIALEIGEKQGEEIKAIVQEYFPNAQIKIEKDMQKRNRFVFIVNQD